MELLEQYKSFIESVPGNTVDENGRVLRITSEGTTPIIWEGKEVILPTPTFLANPDWNKYMPFHPMCESIARGESEIIQLAQTLVRISLWDRFIDISRALLQIAADQSLQTKLTPSQQKYLSPIRDADATTLENFAKIIAKSKHEYNDGNDRRIIALFLRRGGSQDGQHYSRMFVVKFPLYEALVKAEAATEAAGRKVFDVQLRAKDIPILKALHEIIFPGDESAYTIGTNSNLAPYYTALLNGYANMARQLNTVIKPFIKSVKSLQLIDLTWDEGDNLSVFRNKIPPLPHNEGNDPVADPSTAAQAPQQQPMMQAQQYPTQPQPQMQQQPQQQAPLMPGAALTAQPAKPAATIGTANASNKVSWQDLNKQQQQTGLMPGFNGQMQYGQQPGMMQMPGMMPQQQQFYQQPQQFMQQPMMPQQQQFMPQQMNGYMPVMANGMQQPPMPPVSQQPQQQQQYIQQMPGMMPQQQQFYQQPQQQFMPQQGMMQMPGMMPQQQFMPQQGMMGQPQFSYVQR